MGSLEEATLLLLSFVKPFANVYVNWSISLVAAIMYRAGLK